MADKQSIRRDIELAFHTESFSAGAQDIANATSQVMNLIKANSNLNTDSAALEKTIRTVAKSIVKAHNESAFAADRHSSKIQKLERTYGGLVNGISHLSKALASGVIPIASINHIVEYNKSMLRSTTILSSFGESSKRFEQVQSHLRTNLKLTYQQSSELFNQYREGFPTTSLEGFVKLMGRLKDVTGGDAARMQQLMGALGGLSSKFPAIQKSVEDMTEADVEHINNLKQMMLLRGDLGLAESKQISEYLAGASGVNQADAQRRKQIQEMSQQFQLLKERIGLGFGNALLPVFEKLGKWVDGHGPELSLMFDKMGKSIAAMLPLVDSLLNNIDKIIVAIKPLGALALAKPILSTGLFLGGKSGIPQMMAGGAWNMGKTAWNNRGGAEGTTPPAPMGGMAERMAASTVIGTRGASAINSAVATAATATAATAATTTAAARTAAASATSAAASATTAATSAATAAGAAKSSVSGGMLSGLGGKLIKGTGSAFMKAGMPIMMGSMAIGAGLDYAQDKAEKSGHQKWAGAAGVGSGIAGITSMAGMGASFGTMFGPIGTGLGALAGAAIGVVSNFDKLKSSTIELLTGQKYVSDEQKKVLIEDSKNRRKARDENDKMLKQISLQQEQEKNLDESYSKKSPTELSAEKISAKENLKKITEQMEEREKAQGGWGGKTYSEAKQSQESLRQNLAEKMGTIDQDIRNSSSGEDISALEKQRLLIRTQLSESDKTIADIEKQQLQINGDLVEKKNQLESVISKISDSEDTSLNTQRLLTEAVSQRAQATNALYQSTINQMMAVGNFSIEDTRGQQEKALQIEKQNVIEAQKVLELYNAKIKPLREAENSGKITKEEMQELSVIESGIAEKEAFINNSWQRKQDIIRATMSMMDKQTAILSAQAGKMTALVGLSDNYAMGIGTAMKFRMMQYDSIGKQIESEKRALAEFEKQIPAGMSLAEAAQEREERETRILNLTQQQLTVTRAVRDGWVSAIAAMNTGSGTFSKVMMTQNKNVGAMMGLLGDKAVISNIGGSNKGGYRTSERFTETGEIAGAHKGPAYDTWAKEAGLEDDWRSLENIMSGQFNDMSDSMTKRIDYATQKGGAANAAGGHPYRIGATVGGMNIGEDGEVKRIYGTKSGKPEGPEEPANKMSRNRYGSFSYPINENSKEEELKNNLPKGVDILSKRISILTVSVDKLARQFAISKKYQQSLETEELIDESKRAREGIEDIAKSEKKDVEISPSELKDSANLEKAAKGIASNNEITKNLVKETIRNSEGSKDNPNPYGLPWQIMQAVGMQAKADEKQAAQNQIAQLSQTPPSVAMPGMPTKIYEKPEKNQPAIIVDVEAPTLTGNFPNIETKSIPSAKGNVFENGTINRFATGTIVNKPTYFPMTNGQTGLMGESGPEAIMPLTRGSDGKLGVGVSNSPGSVMPLSRDSRGKLGVTSTLPSTPSQKYSSNKITKFADGGVIESNPLSVTPSEITQKTLADKSSSKIVSKKIEHPQASTLKTKLLKAKSLKVNPKLPATVESMVVPQSTALGAEPPLKLRNSYLSYLDDETSSILDKTLSQNQPNRLVENISKKTPGFLPKNKVTVDVPKISGGSQYTIPTDFKPPVSNYEDISAVSKPKHSTTIGADNKPATPPVKQVKKIPNKTPKPATPKQIMKAEEIAKKTSQLKAANAAKTASQLEIDAAASKYGMSTASSRAAEESSAFKPSGGARLKDVRNSLGAGFASGRMFGNFAKMGDDIITGGKNSENAEMIGNIVGGFATPIAQKALGKAFVPLWAASELYNMTQTFQLMHEGRNEEAMNRNMGSRFAAETMASSLGMGDEESISKKQDKKLENSDYYKKNRTRIRGAQFTKKMNVQAAEVRQKYFAGKEQELEKLNAPIRAAQQSRPGQKLTKEEYSQMQKNKEEIYGRVPTPGSDLSASMEKKSKERKQKQQNQYLLENNLTGPRTSLDKKDNKVYNVAQQMMTGQYSDFISPESKKVEKQSPSSLRNLTANVSANKPIYESYSSMASSMATAPSSSNENKENGKAEGTKTRDTAVSQKATLNRVKTEPLKYESSPRFKAEKIVTAYERQQQEQKLMNLKAEKKSLINSKRPDNVLERQFNVNKLTPEQKIAEKKEKRDRLSAINKEMKGTWNQRNASIDSSKKMQALESGNFKEFVKIDSKNDPLSPFANPLSNIAQSSKEFGNNIFSDMAKNRTGLAGPTVQNEKELLINKTQLALEDSANRNSNNAISSPLNDISEQSAVLAKKESKQTKTPSSSTSQSSYAIEGATGGAGQTGNGMRAYSNQNDSSGGGNASINISNLKMTINVDDINRLATSIASELQPHFIKFAQTISQKLGTS